jgi:hypothetical protein
MPLQNAVGDRITTYRIFDRGCQTEEERNKRCGEVQQRGIMLHIWERRKIENYPLEPSVIARVIKQRTKAGLPTPAAVRTEPSALAVPAKPQEQPLRPT